MNMGLRRSLRSIILWSDRKNLGIVCLPLTAFAVSCLFLKLSILRLRGFRECELQLHSLAGLSRWQQASLFASDVLALFIALLAATVCVAARFRSHRRRYALAGAIAISLEAWLILEVASYQCVGAFLPFHAFPLLGSWLLTTHNVSDLVLPSEVLTQSAGWLFITVLAALTALFLKPRDARRYGRFLLAFIALSFLLASFACIGRPNVVWSKSLVVIASEASLDPAGDNEFVGRPFSELMASYHEYSHSHPPSPGQFSGATKGYNVVMFVMESMPAQVVDPANDDLSAYPNLKRLKKHSFVARRHYTSYPLTRHAVFSLFTSMYPTISLWNQRQQDDVRLPGFVRNLAHAGYQTAYYGYVWKGSEERDDLMLRDIGFANIDQPAAMPSGDKGGENVFFGPIQYVEDQDRQALASLLRDLHSWASHDQRFVATFFPEMGHDPWRELPGAGSSWKARGRALAVHQDAWLGQIVQQLADDHLLNHTIIIVTADHGLRVLPDESGSHRLRLPADSLNDLTLRVPLLISVPGVLRNTVQIAAPTSHIDISPTVLELLGIHEERQLEAGLPIWRPEILDRKLFLENFGARGFAYCGHYFMKRGLDSYFENLTTDFADNDPLPPESAEMSQARWTLQQHHKIQNAILTQLYLNRESH